MKKFLGLILCCLVGVTVFSQNTHISYTSNFDVQSAVTVLYSNTNSAFLFQTEPNPNPLIIPSNIYVSELNAQGILNPYGNDLVFTFTGNSYNIIELNGGFEDGFGNIIVYGSLDYAHGIILVFDPNTPSLKYIFIRDNPLISGCTEPNSNFLVFANSFGEIIWLNLTPPSPWTPFIYSIPDCLIKDVSYDSNNSRYIASGSYTQGNTYETFEAYFDNTLAYQDGYRVPQDPNYLPVCEYSEESTVHVQLEKNQLLVCQSIRDYPNNLDILWLTLFDDYTTGNIALSKYYSFPSQKVTVKDMVYNPDGELITILGKYLAVCYEGQNYIAQIDRYLNANSLNTALIDDHYFGNTPCPNNIDYYNGIELKQLIVNSFRRWGPSVLATGINTDFRAHPLTPSYCTYVNQVYDIANSGCDSPVNTPEISNYGIQSIQLGGGIQNQYAGTIFQYTTPSNYPLTFTQLCDPKTRSLQSSENLDPITDDYGEVQAEISLIGNHTFVCNNFAGICSYKIYDMTGRVIEEGKTQNGFSNSLALSESGLYLIMVTDEKGQIVTQKVVHERK